MIPQPMFSQAKDSQRILVVDHVAANRFLLRLCLQHAGYQVDEAGSGGQALALVRQTGAPALVILDVLMPDMDGFAVAEALQSLGTAPIIFLSALSDSAIKTQALNCYGKDYMTKPCNFAELLTCIQRVLAPIQYHTKGDVGNQVY